MLAGRLTGFLSADGSLTYAYDDTNQLTAATPWIGTAEEFAYDANGNRTNTGYTTGPNNRLLSDGTYDYEYDAEGNRTRKTTITTGEAVEYGWDHRNRLVSVTYLDDQAEIVKAVAYDYDAFDRKVAKRVDDDGDGNVDRAYRYVYDDAGKLDPAAGVPLDDVVLVFDAAGSLTTRNLPGPGIDEIFASEDFEQTVLWPLADHQGSIRDVATYDDLTGESAVVNHIRYSAFGEVLDQLANPGDPGYIGESAADELQSFLFAYTGREYDPDADLHYYRARWYDPAAGRFVSEDPLGFDAGDANLQRYVSNNSTTETDPSGLFWGSPAVAAGAGIGAAGGAVIGGGTYLIGSALTGHWRDVSWSGFAGSVAGGAVGGAVAGGLTAAAATFDPLSGAATVGLGIGIGATAGAAGGATGSIVQQGIDNGITNIDATQVGKDTLSGAIGGGLTGGLVKTPLGGNASGRILSGGLGGAGAGITSGLLDGEDLSGVDTRGRDGFIFGGVAGGLYEGGRHIPNGSGGSLIDDAFGGGRKPLQIRQQVGEDIIRSPENCSVPLGRTQRLAEYFERLQRQSPSHNADEALGKIGQTLEQVEDNFSGIPKKTPPPPPNMPDGRMYPPQADNIVRHPDGSITARTRGHEILIGRDGSVTMTNRQTGNVDFQQPGAGN